MCMIQEHVSYSDVNETLIPNYIHICFILVQIVKRSEEPLHAKTHPYIKVRIIILTNMYND